MMSCKDDYRRLLAMPFLGFSLPSFLFVFFIDDIANSSRCRTQRGTVALLLQQYRFRQVNIPQIAFLGESADDHSLPSIH